ncbi:MAG: sugar ABC transporter ATP-binding protein [Actinobacteria bacterium]|nr:sugar ABC transporter ATP-binding protein [Actinomycetota bacterium]MBM3712038.1 sugar ABC transporter ATP-binding protein [Actinomycetota bacterium]
MPNKNEVVLETKALEKHFGGIRAVDQIDMKLYKNEILAIVGDNGAGKSTLIKTITGVYRKDGGEIYLEGNKVDIHNTRDAKNLGIETVYQDKGLISVLDAPSNLFLGREKLRNNVLGKLFRFLDVRYMREETKGLLARIGVEIKDLSAPVNFLSGGQQQSVAVGRAVYWSAKILIFDEPTNNLGVKEQAKAINLIRAIRDTHPEVSIIVITHNLYHVFELVDRIMVLRNGQVIGERERDKTTRNEIVSMITGLAA